MGEKHSFLSASNVIIKDCPAAPIRVEQLKRRNRFLKAYGSTVIPDWDYKRELEDDNLMAKQGTWCHKAVENNLIYDIPIETSFEKLGWSDYPDFIVNNLNTIAKKLKDLSKKAEMWGSEEKVFEWDLDSKGTADFWYVKDKTLFVYDLKAGRVPVQAVGNWQLRRYAHALLKCKNLEDVVDAVQVHIIAPQFSDSFEYMRLDTLQLWYDEELVPAIREAFKVNPEAKTGNHCTNCKAKIHCPEYRSAFKIEHAVYKKQLFNIEKTSLSDLEELYEGLKRCSKSVDTVKKEILVRLNLGENLSVLEECQGRKKTVYKPSALQDLERVELSCDEVLLQKPAFKPWSQLKKSLTKGSTMYQFFRGHKDLLHDYETLKPLVMEAFDSKDWETFEKPRKTKTRSALRAIFKHNPDALSIIDDTHIKDLYNKLVPFVDSKILFKVQPRKTSVMSSILGADMQGLVEVKRGNPLLKTKSN